MARVSISGARNATHALYLDSWIRSLLDASDEPVTVVELDDGVAIEKSQISDDRLSCGRKDEPFEGDHTYLAVGTVGIKPWLSLMASSNTRRFSTVVVDEGLGSYGNAKSQRAAAKREGKTVINRLLKPGVRWLAERLVAPERWPLYERVSDRWVVNGAVAKEFRRAVKPNEPSDEAVYISQPWVELGLVTAREYADHVRFVAEQLDEHGLKTAVLAHHLEAVNDHGGLEVIRSEMPAEIDPRTLSARLVIGENSTALLNLAALFGVPAIRLESSLTKDLESEMSHDQKTLLAEFLGDPVPAHALGPTALELTKNR